MILLCEIECYVSAHRCGGDLCPTDGIHALSFSVGHCIIIYKKRDPTVNRGRGCGNMGKCEQTSSAQRTPPTLLRSVKSKRPLSAFGRPPKTTDTRGRALASACLCCSTGFLWLFAGSTVRSPPPRILLLLLLLCTSKVHHSCAEPRLTENPLAPFCIERVF